VLAAGWDFHELAMWFSLGKIIALNEGIMIWLVVKPVKVSW
jgi:hypothetical protein